MTQISLSFSPSQLISLSNAVDVMEHCMADIRTWMLTEKFKLNDSKT